MQSFKGRLFRLQAVSWALVLNMGFDARGLVLVELATFQLEVASCLKVFHSLEQLRRHLTT